MLETQIYDLEDKLSEVKRKWNFTFLFIFICSFFILLVYFYLNSSQIIWNPYSSGLSSVKGFKKFSSNVLITFLIDLSILLVLLSLIVLVVNNKGRVIQYQGIIKNFYVSYDIEPLEDLRGLIALGNSLSLEIIWNKKGYFQISHKEELLALVRPKELFWKIRYFRTIDL